MSNQKKCSHCKIHKITEYSFWESTDPFITSFKEIKKIKNISIVVCPKCASEWVCYQYGDDKQITDLSPKPDGKDFSIWETTRLRPDKEQMKLLEKIKGINGDAYGNGKEHIIIPCHATFKDGTEEQNCIIYFTKRFTDMSSYYKVKFMSEVKSLQISENALSFEVRKKTSEAQEVANGFAPTFIQDPNGKVYVLNWSHYFFATTKYKGKDFSVYEPENFDYRVPLELSGKDEILNINYCIIYADWEEGDENILLEL